jgi:hypothetical protein
MTIFDRLIQMREINGLNPKLDLGLIEETEAANGKRGAASPT